MATTIDYKQLQSNITIASYMYNGRGERVKKDGSVISYYHYDQRGQLIAETDTSGTTLVEYIYVDNQPLTLITSGNVNYIHNSHLGTPELITEQNQTTVWKADHAPYGKANITVESITNNLRFPGQLYDVETGLHYNMFRYYSPDLDRYITSDPIGLNGGLNTYLYANANPITNVDRLGLCPICPVIFKGVELLGLGLAGDALLGPLYPLPAVQAVDEALTGAREALKKCRECDPGNCAMEEALVNELLQMREELGSAVIQEMLGILQTGYGQGLKGAVKP